MVYLRVAAIGKMDRGYLIKHQLALPGRKALLKSDMEYEGILVDASESPCERQKKGSKIKSE
jgi:hypothetical protein